MIESEMARGVWLSRGEAEATTLEDALDRYEREITPGKKSANGEKSFLRIWRATPLAKQVLASIRSVDVARLRDQWLKVYEPSTVLRRLAVLSHVFTISRKEWGMESLSNPVELVRKPRANDARMRRVVIAGTELPELSNEEVGLNVSRKTQEGELENVVAASGSVLLPSVIWFAVETAMRRSEIVGLEWTHVDLERRVAHLPSTKNGSSRDVPLSTRAVEILKAMRVIGPEDGEQNSDEVDEDLDDRVFKMRSDAVTRAFERAVARARKIYLEECKFIRKRPDPRYLTDLRFHDLRHEATSRLAAIFPMHDLTKITGHKDPKMLMRYYHPRAEDLAKRLA